MAKKKKDNYIIQSVSHAIDILEAFKGSTDEMGVTELSKALELPKNNVFRLLATLESRGFIQQNQQTNCYRLGIKIFELGEIFRSRMGLLRQAHEVLKDVEVHCNESVYLAILQEGMVVYVDLVETTHSVRIVPRLGVRVPPYCTAVGKVMLAYKSVDEVEQLLSKTPLTPLTENTIVDKNVFMEHLKQVAGQGYAVDNEELEKEVKCVGTPVRDYTRRVVAGICISGPIQRMPQERIENELIPLLKRAAVDISTRLGFFE